MSYTIKWMLALGLGVYAIKIYAKSINGKTSTYVETRNAVLGVRG